VGMIKNLIHVCSVYGTVRQQQLRTDGDMQVIPSVPHLRPRRKRLMGRRRGSKELVWCSDRQADRTGVASSRALLCIWAAACYSCRVLVFTARHSPSPRPSRAYEAGTQAVHASRLSHGGVAVASLVTSLVRCRRTDAPRSLFLTCHQ
jgi:hypothetical protein